MGNCVAIAKNSYKVCDKLQFKPFFNLKSKIAFASNVSCLTVDGKALYQVCLNNRICML